jgi:exodeoxyribonuclease VII large subunit
MAETSRRATGALGIPGSSLPGPYPVGEYAAALQQRLRRFAKVQLIGELVNLRVARARAYFELRDAGGAIPCSAWVSDWEQMLAKAGPVAEGMQVVAQGGCDYYGGSASSSPSFSFAVSDLRVAGEGDLLARIDRLRKALDAEGLLQRQKLLSAPTLPKAIGVVCSESGKARDDVLAGLQRRGWAGRLVWGFAPVQDRHAAPAIARALQDLATLGEVEVAIVARGGGSLADLLCFCDETLCRTVAMLQIPVIASVGHHTDRTLLDDVAAISCSTPTHAAEAAVPVDCLRARGQLGASVRRLRADARGAVLGRARLLASLCRAPTEHLRRERDGLHQHLREARAAARRRVSGERSLTVRRLLSIASKAEGALRDAGHKRPAELRRLALALDAHDPERTLQRGYALVQTPGGEPISSAARARQTGAVRLRFADGSVEADVKPDTR